MNSRIIDRESPVAVIGVNINKVLSESDVPPAIILLSLHRGGYHRFHSHHRRYEERTARLERLRRFSIEWDCSDLESYVAESRPPETRSGDQNAV